MIGEQPEELPDWYICENGAMEKQTDGEMNLTDVEEMTFREFTMMSYDRIPISVRRTGTMRSSMR